MRNTTDDRVLAAYQTCGLVELAVIPVPLAGEVSSQHRMFVPLSEL